jgi:hypothetical protein
MFKVVCLDASDPFAVVSDFRPRLNECVEDNVSVEVYDADAGQSVALLGKDSLAVQG